MGKKKINYQFKNTFKTVVQNDWVEKEKITTHTPLSVNKQKHK